MCQVILRIKHKIRQSSAVPTHYCFHVLSQQTFAEQKRKTIKHMLLL